MVMGEGVAYTHNYVCTRASTDTHGHTESPPDTHIQLYTHACARTHLGSIEDHALQHTHTYDGQYSEHTGLAKVKKA